MVVPLPTGPWSKGWTLDWHTRAVPGGYERTDIGEKLYRLKYQYNRSMLQSLAQLLADLVKTRIDTGRVAVVIPIPPSNLDRPFQPVLELARALGTLTGIAVSDNMLVKKRATPMLKDIGDYERRPKMLAGAFVVTIPERLTGQSVLLFDDLFQTGATMAEATRALLQGGVACVYAVVVTRTRTRPAASGAPLLDEVEEQDTPAEPFDDVLPF